LISYILKVIKSKAGELKALSTDMSQSLMQCFHCKQMFLSKSDRQFISGRDKGRA
jgi:hypothetical protein